MNPNRRLFICICMLPLCGLFRLCDATNVLLIIADDLRPSLGCYQQEVSDLQGELRFHTPNIDSLAERGTIFTNAYAQQALCGPSRTSFLTGRRPDSLRTFDNSRFYWRSKKNNITTLPQYFKEHNYATFSAGKVFHPGRLSNKTDDYPYSWNSPTFHPPTEEYMQAKVCGPNHRRNIVCPVNVTEQPGGSLPDLQTADFVVNLLHDEQMLKQPFFIAVGFHKPHVPLKYPAEFRDYYPIEKVQVAENGAIPANLPDVAWNPWMTLRSRDDISDLNISYPYGPMPDFYQVY
uniref:Sulfatase N-terminal domain-containing protein n=1 Tax=Plectus sambesii TaxID=2011161 RepID=A0A914WKJ6_9BILA